MTLHGPVRTARKVLRRSLRGQGAYMVLWPLFWYLVVAGVTGRLTSALGTAVVADAALLLTFVAVHLLQRQRRNSLPELILAPQRA